MRQSVIVKAQRVSSCGLYCTSRCVLEPSIYSMYCTSRRLQSLWVTERGGAAGRERDEVVWNPRGAGAGVPGCSPAGEDCPSGEEGERGSHERGNRSVIMAGRTPKPISLDFIDVHPRQLSAFRLLPARLLSRRAGRLSERELPLWLRAPLLGLYVRVFGCDMSEAVEGEVGKYSSLSALFTRSLKADARPISREHSLVGPRSVQCCVCSSSPG